MSRAWNSKSLAGEGAHRFFYGLIRLCGARVAYVPLFFVVLWYTLGRKARSRSREYLRLRFPAAGGAALWLRQLRLNLAFGFSLVDRAAAGIRGSLHMETAPEDENALRDLAVNGCIVLTAHVGSWQLALPALAGVLPGKVHAVMVRAAGDVDLHVFEHSARFGRMSVIDGAQGPAAAMLMTQALLRGESLGMMGDRLTHEKDPGVEIPFLGRRAAFPIAPFRLASACGVPVAVCFAERTGSCHVLLRLAGVVRPAAGLGPKPDGYAPYLAEYVRLLEKEIELRPYAFFNFYNLWRRQA